MSLWSFATRSDVWINAPIERVYRIAADPEMVPRYVPEVDRVERMHQLQKDQELVRVWIRIGGFRIRSIYRYTFRPPRCKIGVQEDSSLLQGYFVLRFSEDAGRTFVEHVEGLRSPIPGLAAIAGFIYFRLLAPSGVEAELAMLKELVESGSVNAA